MEMHSAVMCAMIRIKRETMTLGTLCLGKDGGRGVGRWAHTVRGKAWTTSTHGFQRKKLPVPPGLNLDMGTAGTCPGFLLVLLLVLVVICKIRPRSAK